MSVESNFYVSAGITTRQGLYIYIHLFEFQNKILLDLFSIYIYFLSGNDCDILFTVKPLTVFDFGQICFHSPILHHVVFSQL